MSRRNSFEEASAGFRAHLPDLSSPRFTSAAKQNIYEYTKCMQDNRAPPWLYDLTKVWEQLLEEPFKGVTNNGTVREGLYEIQDEEFDVTNAVDKAEKLLEELTKEQEKKLSYPINAREWRAWSNPEFLLRPFGLRLEEVSEKTTHSILAILESSLSPEGYQKAQSAMQLNHFLGQILHLPKILHKHSYNFLLFGTPSRTRPWGWLFYGHHLAMACFIQGPQVTLSPCFTGAEPNMIDQGPCKGTQILHREAALGLAVMQNLAPPLRQQARIYSLLRDPGMKQVYALSLAADHLGAAGMRQELRSDEWNLDDQRHQCGAFRDNRVVAYAGVLASLLPQTLQDGLLAIVAEFLLYHPLPSRLAKLRRVKKHFGETYFAWIGGFGDEDAFYYRIQSPVILVEFDHHSGVFLTNREPAKYHTHTIVRMPNGGDYGQAVRVGGERLD